MKWIFLWFSSFCIWGSDRFPALEKWQRDELRSELTAGCQLQMSHRVFPASCLGLIAQGMDSGLNPRQLDRACHRSQRLPSADIDNLNMSESCRRHHSKLRELEAYKAQDNGPNLEWTSDYGDSAAPRGAEL